MHSHRRQGAQAAPQDSSKHVEQAGYRQASIACSLGGTVAALPSGVTAMLPEYVAQSAANTAVCGFGL